MPENYGLDSLNFSPNIKLKINHEKDSTNVLKTIKLRNKKFFSAAVRGIYKKSKEHQDNFSICR